MSRIETKKLACGMPLIVENMPGVRSAGLTWLLPVGAAIDPEDRFGRAAVLEEMLMRGAGEHDSRAQADAFDRIGVSRSISAGLTFVRIGASLIGERLTDALPLIAEMVRKPLLLDESFVPSRELAVQSIESLQDEPHRRASEAAGLRHFAPPFNRSTLGTLEGLAALSAEDVRDGWQSAAVPGGAILSIAGDADAEALASSLDSLLDGWSGAAPHPKPIGDARRGYAHEMDDSNQVQIVLIHDAPPEPHPDSVLERIVVSVLSGGMSGRLFTQVREERALCYDVHAGYRAEKHFGSVSAYVGTTPEKAQEALDVLEGELRRINETGVTSDEFDRAIVGLKSRLVFAGESSSARAAALASDWHRVGRPRSLAEIAEQIDQVTLDELNAYLGRRELGKTTIQTLGPKELTPPS